MQITAEQAKVVIAAGEAKANAISIRVHIAVLDAGTHLKAFSRMDGAVLVSVGLKPTIRRIYADGDTVIVFFDAAGTARDGRPYANTYAWFLRLADGKIVSASAFFDSIAFNDLWQRVSADNIE